jgi:hypothetical protein
MIRAFKFTDVDDPDRELVLSEVDDYDGVELKVAGFAVQIGAADWEEFAELVAQTLSRYGAEPRLRVNLGNECETCEGDGEIVASDGEEPTPCPSCEGRGWLHGKKEAPRAR